MQKIDVPDDLDHTVDSVRQIFTGSKGVARIEAEADRDVGLDAVDRFPQLREVVESPRDGVLSTRCVLDVERNGGLEPLERPDPSRDPFFEPVFGMSGMDDHGGGSDIGRSVADLLEEPAPESATGGDGRADV